METLAGLYALASFFIAFYQGTQGGFYWIFILSMITLFTYPYWYQGRFVGQQHSPFGIFVTFVVVYGILYGIGSLFN
tara:strand:+ start:1284 stop:1514 length:231 start_codon:yes stop_codon:yes gene_type:complete